MTRPRTRTIALGGAAALLVASGGGAVAATKLGDPKAESKQVLADAAKELGVQPSALEKALQNALKSRVDAAVAAGQLTKAQGDSIKARIDAGGVPLLVGPRGFGGRHGGGPGGFGHADRAAALVGVASYLGITESALRTELEAGRSLADVAKANGKSVDGLVSLLVADATKKVDAAVAAGRLTSEQAASIKGTLTQRMTELVNGTRPGRFGWRHGGAAPGSPAPVTPAVVPASLAGSTF